MKIRFWDRLILFAGAVLSVLAGIVLFVAGLQLSGIMEELPVWARALCIAGGLLLIAFGGYVITFPRRYSTQRGDFVVQRTESGELRIAVKAVENLVQKCIDLHEEIKPLSMQILNGREGVVVDLNVSLANNISIPLAIASLQKQIKQYLIASSGIEVKEVRVSVESTQEILPETDAGESGEQAAAPKEKPPLHQRLFGTPDQPAIVPEPPKEDPAPIGWKPAADAEDTEAKETEEESAGLLEEEAPEENASPAEEASEESEDVILDQASETEEQPHE